MSAQLEYRDVSRENYGMMMSGMVRINGDSLKFSNKASGKVFTLNGEDVEQLCWLRMGNSNAIKLIAKDGILHRFAGFPDSDFSKIQSFFKNYWKKEMEKEDHSIKGWNYGSASLEGQTLVFRVDDKLDFEIPLTNVSQVPTGGGKSEVTLEFHPNEDAPVQLVEMRLHKPVEADDEEDQIEMFRQSVMKYVEGETDLPFVIFTEILCATPRGRYDIKVYANRLAFHGKSYDYKIPFNTISRMFLLPHKDQRRVYFVLSIHPPIRQGHTRYPFIVMECVAEDIISLELSPNGKQLEKLCTNKENRIIEGRVYEVLSKIFRNLTNVLITVPPDMDRAAMTCLVFGCAFRQQASGYLYPLEKGFMYVYKPPMYIRFDEIDNVHFARSDATTRSFDFEIVQRNGPAIHFSNIAKEDYNKLFDFVEKKGLKVRNAKRLDHKSYKEDAFAGSDEEELDPYKETLKDNAVSDESDSEDEDFDVSKAEKKQRENASSSDESDSEPNEEYSSGASDITDDLVQSNKSKKDKREKPKKEAKSKKEEKSKKGTKPSSSSHKNQKIEERSPSKKNISKEFVEDSDSSSDDERGNKPSTSAPRAKKPRKKQSSEEESDASMDSD